MCNLIISFLNYNPRNAPKNPSKIGSFFTGTFSSQCPSSHTENPPGLARDKCRGCSDSASKNRWGARSPCIPYRLLGLSVLPLLHYISPYAELYLRSQMCNRSNTLRCPSPLLPLAPSSLGCKMPAFHLNIDSANSSMCLTLTPCETVVLVMRCAYMRVLAESGWTHIMF